MSTHRKVHVITETEHVTNAISLAAKLWPEIETHPEMLLGKILEIGIEEIERLARHPDTNRHEALSVIAGSMDGIWPSNWREQLRDDWPQ
jgi:predicted nuclease with RNAse H fold